LLALVRSVQSTPHDAPAAHLQGRSAPASSASPTCPVCDNAMLRRRNRTTKQAFWGCSQYPACKGTQQFEGNYAE
jgi:restriction system protein